MFFINIISFLQASDLDFSQDENISFVYVFVTKTVTFLLKTISF